MPSMWHWYVRARPEECQLHHLHAVVCRLAEGPRTHRLPIKPFAISPPEPLDGGCRVEVRLLFDDPVWTGRVHDQFSIAAMRGIRLGDSWFEVDPLVPVRARPWGELSAGDVGPGTEVVAVDFMSPTYVRQRNQQLPLPLPGSVLRSIASKWTAFAPECAPDLHFDSARVEIASLKGETVTAWCGKVAHTGFLGSVTYRVANCDAGVRRAVGALMSAAPYTGVGSSTTYGFGTVEVV